MKNFVIILFAALIFSSCKENVVNGFTADSVKEDIIEKLDNSEWLARGSNTFYSKLSFEGQVIALKKPNGLVQKCNFQVTNITAPRPTMPDTIQLRLKSPNAVEEVYITKDYGSIFTITKVNLDDEDTFEVKYNRK